MSKQYAFKLICIKDGSGGIARQYKWPEPGKWTERIDGFLISCQRGYHILRPRQLRNYIKSSYIYPSSTRNIEKIFRFKMYLVEVKSIKIDCWNKSVCRQAKLIREIPWTRRDIKNKKSIKKWMTKNGIELIE